jgi:hypothetical protein
VEVEKDIEDLREDILGVMTNVDDATARNMLSLLLRVLSVHQRLLKEMVDKIDLIIKDEERLKRIVLERYVESHPEHHAWITSQLNHKEKIDYAIDWAANKMAEETASRMEKSRSAKSIMERLIYTFLAFIIGFHVNKFFPHLFGG